jgi:hypothetical protein
MMVIPHPEEFDGPRHAIADPKQCSQRVIGWVTKIYYLELLRASYVYNIYY